jgi:hypothetical protein
VGWIWVITAQRKLPRLRERDEETTKEERKSFINNTAGLLEQVLTEERRHWSVAWLLREDRRVSRFVSGEFHLVEICRKRYRQTADVQYDKIR